MPSVVVFMSLIFFKVNCLFFSAGVGRTGTYITLDTMLERVMHVNNVNVYECVRNLRAKRVLMVQTQVWVTVWIQ